MDSHRSIDIQRIESITVQDDRIVLRVDGAHTVALSFDSAELLAPVLEQLLTTAAAGGFHKRPVGAWSRETVEQD